MDPVSLAILLASGGLIALSMRTEEEGAPTWDEFLSSHREGASSEQLVAFDVLQTKGLPPPMYEPKAVARSYLERMSLEQKATFHFERDYELLEEALSEDGVYVDVDEVFDELDEMVSEEITHMEVRVLSVDHSEYGDGVNAEVFIGPTGNGFRVQLALMREPDGTGYGPWGESIDMWISSPVALELQWSVLEAVNQAARREGL